MRTIYEHSEACIAFCNDFGHFPVPTDDDDIIREQAQAIGARVLGRKLSRRIAYTYYLIFDNGLVAFGYLDSKKQILAEMYVTAKQAARFPKVGEIYTEYYR